MITIKDHYIQNNHLYLTFLTNELSISTVCPLAELSEMTDSEAIDYLYDRIRPTVSEWCLQNNVAEDVETEYISLNRSAVTESVGEPAPEEIAAINDENVRVMRLVAEQKTQALLLQTTDEVNRLKNLVADLASLQLEVL